MTKVQNKGRAIALLPIGVFLCIFIGSGVLTGDFYSMPAIVGFLIALIVAFAQNKNLSFIQKLRLASTGVGDENILTMCLIFLAAGAFSGAVRAAGGVESTVNLGLSILPGGMAVAGLFIIGCFISISMGTSVGTITALAPIAAGISWPFAPVPWFAALCSATIYLLSPIRLLPPSKLKAAICAINSAKTLSLSCRRLSSRLAYSYFWDRPASSMWRAAWITASSK